MSHPANIIVLGAGSWGTALSIVLADNDHRVTLWEHDEAAAKVLEASRTNERFLPGVCIPEGVTVTSQLDAGDADVVVFVVPSHATREVATRASATLRGNAIVVGASKGLEEGTLLRQSEVLREALGISSERIAVLLGPSHAEEVAASMPTSVVAAAESSPLAERVQSIFLRPTFRVYANTDVVGVEIAVALKNCIAIAAGVVDGVGYGDNTKAALITRGLAEIRRLGMAMGASPDTFAGLAGVGDLVVTCLSRHSRNRYVGEQLGAGKSLDAVLAEMVMVAEGVRTTRAAVALGRREGVELPIIEGVYGLLFKGLDPKKCVEELMTRPPRHEHHDSSA